MRVVGRPRSDERKPPRRGRCATPYVQAIHRTMLEVNPSYRFRPERERTFRGLVLKYVAMGGDIGDVVQMMLRFAGTATQPPESTDFFVDEMRTLLASKTSNAGR